MKSTLLLIALLSFPAASSAQKVKVGHDRATDFSNFKTYSWAEPSMPPTRPVLFEAVTARVEVELQKRGLTKVSKDGDLTVMPAGGVDFGFGGQASTPYSPTYGGSPPALNASMWTGSGGGPSTVGAYVSEGTLALTFVDRATNKIVWSGSVKQKLDIEKKNESLALADKAVIKLLNKFPSTK